MFDQAGSSPRPGREFTRIALLALFLGGCCCPPPAKTSCPGEADCAGDRALNEGRPDEARALFFESMRGKKRPFWSWVGVARASIAMGDLRTAELALGQAMQMDPGTASSADLTGRTLLMLAQARGESGRSQANMADLMFQRAERLDPTLPKLAYHRGLAHLAANQPGPAVLLLERAAQADPGDENTVRALLIAYERTHQADRGRALVEMLQREGRLPASFKWEPASRPESAPSRNAEPR